MMLNNKFFHDFDEDGVKITFADYNIAWNWLMQGKPKNMEELDEYKNCKEITIRTNSAK